MNYEAKFSIFPFEGKMHLQSLMTVDVRWPAKNSGVPHIAGFLACPDSYRDGSFGSSQKNIIRK